MNILIDKLGPLNYSDLFGWYETELDLPTSVGAIVSVYINVQGYGKEDEVDAATVKNVETFWAMRSSIHQSCLDRLGEFSDHRVGKNSVVSEVSFLSPYDDFHFVVTLDIRDNQDSVYLFRFNDEAIVSMCYLDEEGEEIEFWPE